MELFKITDINFLGYRKHFLLLSGVMIIAGVASMVTKGGLKMGIDFKGGTLVYAKFSESPDVVRIRSALQEKGLVVSALQPFTEMGGSHELKIDLDLMSTEDDLTSGRALVVEVLDGLYPAEEGKLNFNNTGEEALALRLGRNERVAGLGLTADELREVAEALLAFRDQAPRSGLVGDFVEMAAVPGINPDVIAVLPQETYLGKYSIRGVGIVGPKVGADLQRQARNATLAGLGGMLLVLIPKASLPEPDMWIWVLLALIGPLCFAMCNALVIVLRPPGAPSMTMAAGMSAGATLMLAPVMVTSGHGMTIPTTDFAGNLIILYAAAITATTTVAWFFLVRIVGPVFFSQFNYFIVLGGFGWGYLLDDERHSLWVWIATAMTFVGLAIFTRGAKGHETAKTTTPAQ